MRTGTNREENSKGPVRYLHWKSSNLGEHGCTITTPQETFYVSPTTIFGSVRRYFEYAKLIHLIMPKPRSTEAHTLASRLESIGVPLQACTLYEDARDETLTIEHRIDLWFVYYYERGLRTGLREFSTQGQAEEYFLDEVTRWFRT